MNNSIVETTQKSKHQIGALIRRVRHTFIGASVFVAVILGYATFYTGSVFRALPFLSGQMIFVDRAIDLGKVRSGETVNATIEVVNSGGRSVSIVGARKSCGCIGLEAFPVEVGAGGRYQLYLDIQVPEKSTTIAQSIELYIAEQGQSFVTFPVSLTGTAIE